MPPIPDRTRKGKIQKGQDKGKTGNKQQKLI